VAAARSASLDRLKRVAFMTETETVFHMPPELVDEDGVISHLRIDGLEDTRGKAKAAFASEWGIDFTNVRVTKAWFGPPEPMCDECCEKSATCGVEMNWSDNGPPFTEKVCAECQAAVIAHEGSIFARLSMAEPRTLEEVTPYDGWPVMSAKPNKAGVVAYWHGEQA
jgi:hypothetical protein